MPISIQEGAALLQRVRDAVATRIVGQDAAIEDSLVGFVARGHAEVVQVTFDPNVISFRDLLGVFFTIHDPTTLNRQGADVGPQYRSIVLYHSPAQRAEAEQVIAELNAQHVWDDPIVTEVKPVTTYYPAEQYHQDYFANNSRQPYCQAIIAPKVAKFRKAYLDRLVATSS